MCQKVNDQAHTSHVRKLSKILSAGSASIDAVHCLVVSVNSNRIINSNQQLLQFEILRYCFQKEH